MIGKTNAISGVSAPVPKIKTVSGSVISISDALAMPAVSLIADINAVQNLNGYDSPWPAGGGKNICPPFEKGTSINATTGAIGSSQTSATTGKIPVNFTQNPNYYLSGMLTTLRSFVAAYNSSDQFLGRTAANSNADKQLTASSFTGGTPQGTGDIAYVRITIYEYSAGTGVIDDIDGMTAQMEVGSSASSYEPYENICPITGWSNVNVYREAQYDAGATPYVTINLNGTVYGGSLDVTTGVLTLDMASIDLGSLSWTYYTAQQIPIFYADISGSKSYPTAGTSVKAYCSNYKVESTPMSASNFSSLGYFHAAFNAVSYPRVLISDSRYTDKNTFKTAMSGVQFVYELATPQTVQLTPTQVQMLLGNNVIWADSGDTELQYWARR